MSIDHTRWMIQHFDPDPVEAESIAFTIDLLKTVAVAAFALVVIQLVV